MSKTIVGAARVAWPVRFLPQVLGMLLLGNLRAADLIPADIGGALDGGTRVIAGGHELSSRSRDIGASADELHFAYQRRTGNFDVQVRIASLRISDAFVQAGILARSALDARAPFAGIFSSSAQLGCLFESRPTVGAAAQTVMPPIPIRVNYPEMYVRLKRSGSVFTGFASYNGQDWYTVGTANFTLPNEVLLGLGLASHNTNLVSAARFHDFVEVATARAATFRPVTEPPGPSNRRTGVVISEIMYHPRPAETTNSLEFVEIYNGENIFVDLTGWRLAGGIEYTFPAGFKLQAGEFAVVAADPPALEKAAGVQAVLGPFSGRLNNAGDTIQLLNQSGAVRWEMSYDNRAPWPVAADGTGHSLVLTHPSYGEDDPRAWAASGRVGGSPGEIDAIRPGPLQAIVINEFLAHTDDPVLDFIELYNASTQEVDLSGCILTDDAQTNRFRIPNGTILAGRGWATFTQNDLGFALRSEGETLYLLHPAADRVLDAVRFDGQENGVSTGRTPDGAPEFRRLATTTPGGANAPWRVEPVVINELMYHPITGQDDDQYVELHNRSSAQVDLSGWRFTDGIDFEFPEGARIPADGYLVVARNAERLRVERPQLTTNNTWGNFAGQLSRSGERVALSQRDFVLNTNEFGVVLTQAIYIDVSEVSYRDGGRWPELADGGGSSLELTDPRADARRAANWAASDESGKAPWTTVETTGRLEMGAGQTANRLQVIMQGAGECLIDNIELIPQGSTNILVNGDFEASTSVWRFFGNHSGSVLENAAAFAGNLGLRVRATGDGDTANNAIRGNMTRVLMSGTATIRAQVRWISGWPEVLIRIRGNWLELPARLSVPINLGTPGLANSRRVSNAGPAIYDVQHFPPVPRASEAVVVTCRVSDPDGVAQPRLRFRLDPASTVTTVVMRDDGSGVDALAGDGLFSASIAGRAAGTLAAFRIEASDDAPNSASRIFPAPRECLIRWGDALPAGTMAHYHLWSTAATDTARRASRPLDNTFRDATLVYGNTRVIYNAGFRDKGSPYHGGSGDLAVTVGRDDLLLGIDDRVFASTGNGGSESTGMKTDVAGWLGGKLGIPFLHSHYMRLYWNGGQFREVSYDMEQPNRYYSESWFGRSGVKDDLFKISIWFEFADDNSNFSSTGATLERFLSGGQFKLARYRWNWQIRPSIDTANDHSTIFNLASAANSTTDRTRVLPLLADMEEWMRVFAFHRIVGNWDSWSFNVGQNMYLYAPLGGRAALLPWDIDFVLGEGEGPTGPLFTAGQDGVVQQLMNLPVYRRMLWRAYQDAIAGPLIATNFQPQIDARRALFSKNGVTGVAAPTSITSFLNTRRGSISNQLQAADAKGFAITSNSGADFTSPASSTTITGFAPFAVASIEVNGVPFPIVWNNHTNWQISVPLGGRTNRLEITGRDLRGNAVTSAVDTVTVEYTGELPRAADWVVLNEIMYNSLEPNADFIELHNRHPSFAFDLSGYELRGANYSFPAGSFIQPNGYLVVAGDRAAFAAVYGRALPVLGPYAGALQRNGETLRLVQSGFGVAPDLLIDEVRYENILPWPTQADGLGPSLQLVDPAQDNARAGNWAATTPNDPARATPGRANSLRLQLEPFPQLWLNEVQPATASGPRDNAGEQEPWVELYNGGSTAIEFGGLSLSDDPARPGQWQFPAGTRLEPGQFLIVWLDNEPNESIPGSPHAAFRLSGTNGVLVLSRAQPNGIAVVDYLRWLVTAPGNSFGSIPDGQPKGRRNLFAATPGTRNDPTIPAARIWINEWMAAGHAVVQDPADGHFEDWFELHNAGTNTVDLSGYFLTDSLSDPELFPFPPGYKIGPGEYRLIWADNEPLQNSPGRDLHVNFSLSANGEELGIFTPDGQPVDTVQFGAQTGGRSEGRFPDATPEPFTVFVIPTPGTANQAQFANQPPKVEELAGRSLNEGETLAFRVAASDPDQPSQTLTFSLLNAPEGAAINPQTGDFTWVPSEAQGPGTFPISVRVTDNGVPARGAGQTFTVIVLELNQPPRIPALADATIDEGTLYQFTVPAIDTDFPGQALAFALDPGSPEGASLDPVTGEFSWRPAEAQGPGQYRIAVRVTDNGQPPLSVQAAFNLIVNDVNNPPVIDEIPSQSVDEETEFRVRVTARDAEVPAAPLSYSIESGPEGVTIDPTTGELRWTPAEAAGPRDYNIVVRASEPGGSPSATASFVLGVREVNRAPELDPIADRTARPGEVIALPLAAVDHDLPAQNLRFEFVDRAPEGATLDPVTGLFSWTLTEDPPAGPRVIAVRVTDNGTPALAAERTFRVQVEAPATVAINEILHRPTVPNAEFVELWNYSAVNDQPLGGWRLEGYRYTFPAGTILRANSYLCVARDLAAFRAAYGAAPEALGNATIDLPREGGILRLIQPATATTPQLVVDEAAFSLNPPWPGAAASKGASLQLINPRADHRRLYNWISSEGLAADAPASVVPIGGGWRYWQSATAPAAEWKSPAFPDTSWPLGNALLYVEPSELPAPKQTALTLGPTSYYFRTRFNHSGLTTDARLRMQTILDDGAVFYLNGQEVFRLGMPAGGVTAGTLANRTQGDASLEGPFEFPAPSLRAGENLLAVEVHQASTASSDIVFGAAVDLLASRLTGFTPGVRNSTAIELPSVPPVWLNELLPRNTAGLTDRAGDRDPWIELYNAGGTDVNLAGWRLTDDLANLAKWAFPAGQMIPAGGYLLVWADGEPGESTLAEPHTSFRIPPDRGFVALSVPQGGASILIDYLAYEGATPNLAFGLQTDGNPLTRASLAVATPGASNRSTAAQLRFETVAWRAGGLQMTWRTETGKTYKVESTTDLRTGRWESTHQVSGDGQNATLIASPNGSSQRYFRLVIP